MYNNNNNIFDPVTRIYLKLKDTLINGYVGENPRARSYITWKCTIPTYVIRRIRPENTVQEDFNILEEENVVSIDMLDNLKEIFREIHAEAVREIDKASREIQEAKARQSTENTADSRFNKITYCYVTVFLDTIQDTNNFFSVCLQNALKIGLSQLNYNIIQIMIHVHLYIYYSLYMELNI